MAPEEPDPKTAQGGNPSPRCRISRRLNPFRRRRRVAKDDSPTRHPLVLLLVGFLLTSVAVPFIAGIIHQRQLYNEGRQAKAVQLIQLAHRLNAQINVMESAFVSFEVDINPYTDKTTYHAEQKELRKTISALRWEFDGSAWWSFWNISEESRINGWLNKSEQFEVEKAINALNKNFEETMVPIDRSWERYLSKPGPPEDPIYPASEAERELRRLQDERMGLVKSIVANFEKCGWFSY
jgi:hypothetical protein